MPSANPKLEKQASTEPGEPVRQAIIVIEHKIRNLEKRKGKLEAYRDLQKNGRELNADQKTAVDKYNEVLQTLDITRELYKQIISIANDALKQQKKLARKEALERMQQDIAKVREVLLIQDVLMNMGVESAREDFLAGTNGAVKLSEDDIKYLDDLHNELNTKHHPAEGEPTFLQQVQKVAEHFVAIIEGKQRDVVGTTYNRLKEIITSINQSGYFDQVHEVEAATEEAYETAVETQPTEVPVQEQVTEEYDSGDRHIPPASMLPIPNFPVQVAPLPVVSVAAPVSGPIPVVPQPIPPHPAAAVETSYYTNATGFVPQPQPQQQQQSQQSQQQPPQTSRINDVIGTPNFFFLQESELDSPDVTSQTPIVSHIPPAVNAPIPSQTFTNQNFTNAAVVPQQVIYQHQPPQDMSHIPGFANPNPPPPIPMPPSHQQPNIQYSPQHPTGFQQQPQQQQQPPQQMPQQTQGQNFDQTSHPQDNQQQLPAEEQPDENQDSALVQEPKLEQQSEPVDWSQMTESGDWNQADVPQQSPQDTQQHPQRQASQQAWGDQQRGGNKGRGGRRGHSNGYNGRGRGGGYQQNGRGGQGTYYRNDSNYQNGYQQRSWGNNEGNGGYSTGFKRGGGGARGGPRGDRSARGQFRGQRGGNRGGYAPRGKPQTQQ